MMHEITKVELQLRRDAAQAVYHTRHGKQLFACLLDDLGFYDITATEAQEVLRNFALVILKNYFGLTDDYGDVMVNQRHREELTETILGVEAPRKELLDE